MCEYKWRDGKYSCIHVCMKSYMKGAAVVEVLGALESFCEANVPVTNVRFVSGRLVEKFAGL